jgi:rootletin
VQDRERMRRDLEASKDDAIIHLNQEKEDLIVRFEKEREQLSNDIARVNGERDTIILNAENERQQLLAIAQQEKNGFFEKINLLKEELNKQVGENERLKRESAHKHEQDKNHLLNLQDELKRIRLQ